MRVSALVFVVALSFLGCAPSRPPQGSMGGTCYGDGTCNAGLVCHSSACVPPFDAASDGATAADAGADAGP